MSQQKEFKDLQKDSVEGCVVWLTDDSNFLEWQGGLFGPPETIFQGAYFKVNRGVLCSSWVAWGFGRLH